MRIDSVLNYCEHVEAQNGIEHKNGKDNEKVLSAADISREHFQRRGSRVDKAENRGDDNSFVEKGARREETHQLKCQ